MDFAPHREGGRPRGPRPHRRRRPPLHGRRGRQHGREPQHHLVALPAEPRCVAGVRDDGCRGHRPRLGRPRGDRGVRAGRAPGIRRSGALPRARPHDHGGRALPAPPRVPPAGHRRPRRPSRARPRRRARGAPRSGGQDRSRHRREGPERTGARPRRPDRPRDRPLDRDHHRRARGGLPLDLGHLLRPRRDRRRAHRAPPHAPRDPGRDARVHRVRADPAAGPRRAARAGARGRRRAPRDGRRLAAVLRRQHPSHPDPVDPPRSRPRDRPPLGGRRRSRGNAPRRSRTPRHRHRAGARVRPRRGIRPRREDLPPAPRALHRLPGTVSSGGRAVTRRVEVAIVGAGFAGLSAAMTLRDAGHDIAIFERADRVGGTWRDNTYPGVACDVPSHLYGFARHPEPSWSAEFAPGAEIQAYIERVADREQLGDRIAFDWPLVDAEWDQDAAAWRLAFGGAESAVVLADALVLACGRLSEPRIPDIAGLESFAGPLFHSARWDHRVDLDGAHVAVVGSGASAVQLVPALAKRAGTVTLFQRSPAWILPRGDRAYAPEERAGFAARPEKLAQLRARLDAEGEARFASRSGGPDAAAAEALARAHLAAQIADPALRAALTPDYAFGCKRVLLSDEFYPAVASDSVTLVRGALSAVEGSTLAGSDGSRHEVDALVLATGFASTRQPYAELVRGEDETLAEHWAAGM